MAKWPVFLEIKKLPKGRVFGIMEIMNKFESAYTGKLIEEEVFGGLDRERVGVLNDIGKTYLPYRQAMEIVKKMQPFDPSDPEPLFANDLHATITEGLKLDDYDRLKFFTALNSHLDFFHGVDAFFELTLEDGKKIVITLDITQNVSSKDTCKADVLILMPDQGLDPQDDRKMYTDKIKQTAEEIVAIIKSKAD